MNTSIGSKVCNFIKKNRLLHKDNHVIVGLSGGADSICLLHMLYTLKNEFNLKITAIHINHMIRGDEALRDEQYVVDFCNNLGIDIIVKRINVLKMAKDMKVSTEEAGRCARYDTFYEYKKKLCANKIAIAHNKNDNAETVIMNIVRGCGLNGLKGIDFFREDIIRPLAVLKRKEIEEYCNANNLRYMTDSTNNEPIYTRNKIRLKLIKIIDDILNVDVVSRIDKMSQLVKEDNDFINSFAKKVFNRCLISESNSSVLLSVKDLKEEHKAIQRRVILEAILKVKGNLKMVECKHVDGVLDLIDNGTKICLPQDIRVLRSYDKLLFYKEEEMKKDLRVFSIKLDNFENKVFGDDFVVETKVFEYDSNMELKNFLNHKENNVYVSFFDYEKLGCSVEVRKRRDGDIFKPLNSNGTKKLKKYFIDKKIDRLKREEMYLLSKEKEIVWIIGDKVSDNYKVTKNTRKIVRVTFVSMI